MAKLPVARPGGVQFGDFLKSHACFHVRGNTSQRKSNGRAPLAPRVHNCAMLSLAVFALVIRDSKSQSAMRY